MIPPEVLAAARSASRPVVPLGPFVSTTLAQWAVESGWGKHVSGVNNYFGIKAVQSQIDSRNATQVLTHEYVNGSMQEQVCWFANYTTLEEGFAAHTSLLLRSHYKACQDAKTPEDYCHALQACGYATAPNYAAVLINTIQGNDLTQYDQTLAVAPLAPPQAPAKPVSPAAPAGNTGGVGTLSMAAQNFSMAEFLQFLQDIPFDQIAAAAASGGANIPADIAAAEAVMSSLVTHFFSGGSAASAAPVVAAAAGVPTK